MSTTRALATFLAGALLLPAACSAPGARVQLGYMQPSLTGSIGLSPSAGSGSGFTATVDVEDSLGLKDTASTAQIHAELDAGPVRVTASAFRYSQSGNGTLQASFGDLSAGIDVTSDVDLTNAKVAVTFDLLDLGVVRISPGLGADLFKVQARVTEISTGTFEDVDELLPVPMLFLQSEGRFGPLSAELDLGYLDVDLGDTGGTYFDLEALVAYDLTAQIELNAGYRYISMDANGKSDGQDLTADLTLQGWFIGGGIRF
ncbi:MAG: hypothetical protein U1F36_18515 [Planctomycetota bacterium]